MRLLMIGALLLAAPFAAHARFMPQAPPTSDRAPGIVDIGSRTTNPPIGHDIRDTRKLIERSRDNGSLSRPEARALRREARQIGVLADRYGKDGMSDAERRELETRVQILRAQAIAPKRP